VSDKVAVSLEEAVRRLGDAARIHTFVQAGFALVGADWHREEVIDIMRKHGVENSGEAATAMGHTLVVRRPSGPLFIEAGPEETE
jgi:hypothetical protein